MLQIDVDGGICFKGMLHLAAARNDCATQTTLEDMSRRARTALAVTTRGLELSKVDPRWGRWHFTPTDPLHRRFIG